MACYYVSPLPVLITDITNQPQYSSSASSWLGTMNSFPQIVPGTPNWNRHEIYVPSLLYQFSDLLWMTLADWRLLIISDIFCFDTTHFLLHYFSLMICPLKSRWISRYLLSSMYDLGINWTAPRNPHQSNFETGQVLIPLEPRKSLLGSGCFLHALGGALRKWMRPSYCR